MAVLRYMPRFILIALFAAAPCAVARDKAEIVKIYSGKQWNMNDSICFSRAKGEIVACGKVVGTTSYLVSIRVDSLAEKVSKGEKLYVAATGPGRATASYGDTYVVTRTMPLFLHAITAGAFGSSHFVFPMAHIQAGLGKGFLLGFMPGFASSTGATGAVNASILGTFLTLEGYFNGISFDGFNAGGALGLYSIRASNGFTTDGVWVPAFQATLGWRFLDRSGFTFGLNAGVQYLSAFGSSLINLSWTGLQPLFRADIGFSF